MSGLRRAFAAGGLLAALACAARAAEPPKRIAEGSWGGDHAVMTVVGDSANIEFDCANGRIDGPLVVGDDGRFDLRGFFKRERPGPARQGDEATAGEPARYTGTLRDKTLEFTITLVSSGEAIATHRVTLGAHGRVHKCL